jgi:hypothetical protein
MKYRDHNKLYPSAVMFGLLGGLSHTALAQVTTVDVSGAKPAVLEEVVILGTGTSIRGIAAVGSPMFPRLAISAPTLTSQHPTVSVPPVISPSSTIWASIPL